MVVKAFPEVAAYDVPHGVVHGFLFTQVAYFLPVSDKGMVVSQFHQPSLPCEIESCITYMRRVKGLSIRKHSRKHATHP